MEDRVLQYQWFYSVKGDSGNTTDSLIINIHYTQTAQLDFPEQIPEHLQNSKGGNNRISVKNRFCAIALKALKNGYFRVFPEIHLTNGIQEVSGSIPLISTRTKETSFGSSLFRFKRDREPLTSCISIRVSLLIVAAKPDDQRFDPAYLHQQRSTGFSRCFFVAEMRQPRTADLFPDRSWYGIIEAGPVYESLIVVVP